MTRIGGLQMNGKIVRTQMRIPAHIRDWLNERSKKSSRFMNGELVNLLATMKAKDLEKQLQGIS